MIMSFMKIDTKFNNFDRKTILNYKKKLIIITLLKIESTHFVLGNSLIQNPMHTCMFSH